MRRMRGPLGAVLALALVPLAVFAQPAPAPRPAPAPPRAPVVPAVSPTAVAATVNGQPIYEQAVERAFAVQDVPTDQRRALRPLFIDRLADSVLVEQYLMQLKVDVPKADVDKLLAETHATSQPNGKDLKTFLAELKIDEKEFRQTVTAELRWERFIKDQAKDKALRDYFDANKDSFDGSAVFARHIRVTPRGDDPRAHAEAQAQLRAAKAQVEARVQQGLARLPASTDKLAREKARGALLAEAFSAAAREKSDCPTRQSEGNVGWFSRVGPLPATFTNAAFAMQPFQMTDVVRTPAGYHLILVMERKPGRQVRFEEVKEMVKAVYADRMRENIAATMRARSKIVVNPPPH